MKTDIKYEYDKKNEILTIYYNPDGLRSNTAVIDFCKDYRINLDKFNLSVIIGENVQNCTELLKGCKGFDQPIVLHDHVVSTLDMFCGCESFDQPIILPKSIQVCSGMFKLCKNFNQKVVIPDNVVKTAGMFVGCEMFDQLIELPESVRNSMGMFRLCKNFNQKVVLPKDIESCDYMFDGCSKFNQPVTLGEKVEKCWAMFHDCVSLNQPIEILSVDCICNEMFKNCDSLEPEKVTIHTRKTSQKNIIKRFQKMWDTEEVISGVNVVFEKVPPKKKISSIEYQVTDGPRYAVEESALNTSTAKELSEMFEGLYNEGELALVEMTVETGVASKTLAVYVEGTQFCIGIIDDYTSKNYYYNSGAEGEDVGIRGNDYPRHMVSDDINILKMIMEDFIRNGRPSKKVGWIVEVI